MKDQCCVVETPFIVMTRVFLGKILCHICHSFGSELHSLTLLLLCVNASRCFHIELSSNRDPPSSRRRKITSVCIDTTTTKQSRKRVRSKKNHITHQPLVALTTETTMMTMMTAIATPMIMRI